MMEIIVLMFVIVFNGQPYSMADVQPDRTPCQAKVVALQELNKIHKGVTAVYAECVVIRLEPPVKA